MPGDINGDGVVSREEMEAYNREEQQNVAQYRAEEEAVSRAAAGGLIPKSPFKDFLTKDFAYFYQKKS